MAGTITILDGSVIADTITGLFITATELRAEWTGLYAIMRAGHADMPTAVQRMEGNAESVMESTGAAQLSAISPAILRQARV